MPKRTLTFELIKVSEAGCRKWGDARRDQEKRNNFQEKKI